jgi:protein phosphatase PTC7
VTQTFDHLSAVDCFKCDPNYQQSAEDSTMKLSATVLFVTSLLLPKATSFVPSTRRHVFPSSTSHITRQSPSSRLSVVLFDTQLKPLATEGDWTAFLDAEGTGIVYYFNGITGESMWEPPTETFPDVQLKGSVRRKARQKQEEYVKAVAEQEQKATNKGFLSGLLADEDKQVANGEKQSQDDWFSFLYEYRQVRQREEENVAGSFLGNLFAAKPKPLEMEQKTAPVPEISAPEEVVLEAVPEFVEEEEEPVDLEPITIDMGAYVLPHPAKVRWGGEDAVFTKGRTFGVMDGVSGADKLEGVPLYSKTLVAELKESVGEEGLDIRQLSKLLSDAAETADQTATGASTAIVASISENGFLRVLNVGDSTCIIIRNGKVAGKSREISHYFECPYQLSADSPDRPKDGTKWNVELLKGDIILMASDGVFDNISEDDVAEMVAAGPKPTSVIAKRVADKARKVSVNNNAETPYAKMAKRYGDPNYSEGVGGKLDDVCCVVVRYG